MYPTVLHLHLLETFFTQTTAPSIPTQTETVRSSV